jgi:hypothetical protein
MAEVGKLRPAGRMRPARVFYAARGPTYCYPDFSVEADSDPENTVGGA